MRGIAISLNLFLKQLDVLGIEHESAAAIRKDLQSRNDAIVGWYKQYFLRHTSKQTKISRSGPHASHEVKCRTSVAIPRAWVPHGVMKFLTGTSANVYKRVYSIATYNIFFH